MIPPLHIQTASIGIPDTLFLMLLALVVFGPRRLPEIGRQIGKLMYEFRKVSNDFKYQMEEELRAAEEADRQKKLQAEAAARAAAPPAPEPAPSIESSPALPVSTAEATPATDSIAETAYGAAPSVEGEVRGEPRHTLPGEVRIQPPSTGETVAASRPFRAASENATSESPASETAASETTEAQSHTTESSSETAGEVPATPEATEAPAGESSGMEQPAHHA